ncbi:MAG: PKD domain-containing protein [Phycisphaerae bacterium]|nr:PKD domain-containing protein [Phycisphaerae bacterium]
MGGAYPALSTGMRHPDIFRAIALRQPAFDARFFETCLPYLDVYQPVFVLYGMTDLARDQSIECADWLRENRVAVTAQELGTANKRQPEPLYAFLRGVVRTRPWIRVLATEPDASRPLAVQFAVRSSVPIETYEWSFGDGESSAIAAPEHTYANEGSYAVQVTVGDGKKRHVRRIEVSVPRARLGIVPQGQ